MRAFAIAGLMVVLTTAAASPLPVRADPSKCSRVDARALVKNFISAYDRGDLLHLDGMWAKGSEFKWYSVGPTAERPDSRDRSTLISYFAQRHDYGDDLRLIDLRIARKRGWHGGWDFSYELFRATDDPILIREGYFNGKGAATKACLLFVWAMARQTP